MISVVLFYLFRLTTLLKLNPRNFMATKRDMSILLIFLPMIWRRGWCFKTFFQLGWCFWRSSRSCWCYRVVYCRCCGRGTGRRTSDGLAGRLITRLTNRTWLVWWIRTFHFCSTTRIFSFCYTTRTTYWWCNFFKIF